MRALFVLTVAVTAGVAGFASPALAQRAGPLVRASPELGIRGGRDFSVDIWTAGAHLRLPLGRTLDFRPSADFSVEDPGDDFQINGDLALRGPRDQAYLGAGVGYVHRQFGSDDSAFGPNLFLGFKPVPRAGSQIYLEGRWTFVKSETLFRLVMGVTFPF